MPKNRAALCTGFWCTNIGNAFFGLGAEYALRQVLDSGHVTVVSDLQSYTTGLGRRRYPHPNQLDCLSCLDVDYLVLAGPVLSPRFLALWKDVLLGLKARGIGYILLSTGMADMDRASCEAIKRFLTLCPPYGLSSREERVYLQFGQYARHAYHGICCSFFVPDAYQPVSMTGLEPYVVYNFDKMEEPVIRRDDGGAFRRGVPFSFEGSMYRAVFPAWQAVLSAKRSGAAEALLYARSVFPPSGRPERMGDYRIIRTNHRFYPHYRSKLYRRKNAFASDLPYGYLNLYANTRLTLSDRVHACAVTLAFGGSAMLLSRTDRAELLRRVGAEDVCRRPVTLDMARLEEEKTRQLAWLRRILAEEAQ